MKIPLAGKPRDDLTTQIPNTLKPSPADYTDFEDKFINLIGQKPGKVYLCSLPSDWDALYGEGRWKAERPVASARKACSPPYVHGVEVINEIVCLVGAIPCLEPACLRAADDDVAKVGNFTADSRRLVGVEFQAVVEGSTARAAYSQSSGRWRCELQLQQFGLVTEAVAAAGFGIGHEDALLMARVHFLEQRRRWCNSSDAGFQHFLDVRLSLQALQADFQEMARSAKGGGRRMPHVRVKSLHNQVCDLTHRLCSLLTSAPACIAVCWELLSIAWPHILATLDLPSIECLAAVLNDAALPIPVKLWASMAEAAAWYPQFDALNALKDLRIAETTPTGNYVRHHLYSLFLEQRAQLREEGEQHGSHAFPMDVQWEAAVEGWCCTFDAAQAPGMGRGSPLWLTGIDVGKGIFCEVVDDGKAIARAVPGLGALEAVLSTPRLHCRIVSCHASVHARQREAVLTLAQTEDSPFDAALLSLIVNSWPTAVGSKASPAERALAGECPPVFKGSAAADRPRCANPSCKFLVHSDKNNNATHCCRVCKESQQADNDEARHGWLCESRLSEDCFECALTDAQEMAVVNAVERRCSLIRGPPGTGKTYVAAAIAAYAVAKLPQGSRVLATTQSNAAALNLHRRLEEFGVRAARIGMGLRPSEIVQQRLFAHVRACDPEDADVLLLERAAARELRPSEQSRDRADSAAETAAVAVAANTSPSALHAAQFAVLQRLARMAGVVVITCASSGNRGLLRNLGRFPLMLLDEAAQIVEPGPLVPLMLGCESMVLVGDERQLPATVLDKAATRRGLGASLFERLVQCGLVSAEAGGFVQLDEQRRMHPSISEFPARRFYAGAIRDAGHVDSERPAIPGFPWPAAGCQVCFVDCGGDARSGEQGGRSHSNQFEAKTLVRVLQRCLEAGTEGRCVAVITGYSAQQDVLKRMVKDLGPLAAGVKVDTVDGFQGAERDLVLASTVRANATGDVGFLRDPRRVNVMLTRARRGLIVFGDARTLQGEQETWQPWLSWVEKRGAIVSAARVGCEVLAAIAPQEEWTLYTDAASGRVWRNNNITGEAAWLP